MFEEEPSLGLPLLAYFNQDKVKGFRMRNINVNYPFDDRKKFLVVEGEPMDFHQFL